jgi:signal peptidase II
MHRNAFYAVALFILVLDQVTKAWLRASLPLHESVPLLPGIFHITHTQNTGAAFSLFQGATPLLAATAIIVIAVLVAAQRRAGTQLPLSLALSLALPLGGALGNLMDRLRLGYVTDMFDFRLINFPVFNVADSAITVGIALLAWRTLTVHNDTQTQAEVTGAPAAEDAPVS